jgi:hypothetical protein
MSVRDDETEVGSDLVETDDNGDIGAGEEAGIGWEGGSSGG